MKPFFFYEVSEWKTTADYLLNFNNLLRDYSCINLDEHYLWA